MKKMIALCMAAVMSLALLAGCGGDTTADDTTDDTASNDAAQEETAELSGTVATDGSTSRLDPISTKHRRPSSLDTAGLFALEGPGYLLYTKIESRETDDRERVRRN